jgi:hypothetical protein
MRRFLLLNDQELDRVLSGRALADDRDLDELAAFVGELIYAFRAAPDAVTEARHLNAIRQGIRALPPDGLVLTAATAGKTGPARRNGWLLGGSWAARLLLAGALAFGLFSGVAYAGALPGPVQGAVSDVARNVGVSLPGAHNDKDDGARNDKQDGPPRVVPAPTQMGDNVVPETSRQGDNRSLVRPSGSEQENEPQAGASQQQGDETRNRDEENGTNGSSNSGQGAHGNIGARHGAGQSGGNQSGSQGAGSQGGGTQGRGGNESGSAGDGSQGDQGNGEN